MANFLDRPWGSAEKHRGEDSGESAISLKDVAFILCARARSILLVAAFFVAGIALAVFWLISPTYEAKARIHVDIQSGSLPVLRAQGSYVSDAEKLAFFETVIQELKNQPLLEAVVKELNLGETRVLGNIERIKNFYGDARRWFGRVLGIASWQKPYDPVAASVEALGSGLAVSRLENSTILELAYEAKDAREAEQTLSSLIRQFIQSRNLFTFEKASGSTQFLSQEIARLRAEIAAVEDAWVSAVKSDLYRLPVDVVGGEPSSAGGEPAITGLAINERVVEEMKIHVIRLQDELQTNLTRYSASDPNVRRLRQMIRSYAAVINRAPEMLTRVRRLAREVASKEAVYRDLLAARENALTMESGELKELSTIKVVQPPKLPGAPSKPKRTLAMAAGLVLGLFFGVLLAFVAEFFSDTVRRPQDVEKRIGLRCVSSLPHV